MDIIYRDFGMRLHQHGNPFIRQSGIQTICFLPKDKYARLCAANKRHAPLAFRGLIGNVCIHGLGQLLYRFARHLK